MTIETTRAPEGAKNVSTGANRAAASSSRQGAAGAQADASAGFADLMSLLSASDAQAAPADGGVAGSAVALVASDTTESDEQNMPIALDAQGLIAPNLIMNALPAALPVAVPVALPAAPADAAGRASSIGASSTNLLGAKSRTVATETKPDLGDAGEQTAVANTAVATLLDHRRVSQSHAAVQTQAELRQASLQTAGHQPVAAALEVSRAAPILLNADVLQGSADRREGRPGTGQLRTGLEGAMGSAVTDRMGINPTYEVAAASAVVADTQVAETVSYWATQGVQSAELTLDGLGDEPVEVHISVDGDQAQIDFRTNQPEIRQVLESASAQLKTMLSGEGLQLAGMSVGTSSRGDAQDGGRQPKPGARQTARVAMEPVRASSTRVANAAVGQALDLFV